MCISNRKIWPLLFSKNQSQNFLFCLVYMSLLGNCMILKLIVFYPSENRALGCIHMSLMSTCHLITTNCVSGKKKKKRWESTEKHFPWPSTNLAEKAVFKLHLNFAQVLKRAALGLQGLSWDFWENSLAVKMHLEWNSLCTKEDIASVPLRFWLII